MVSHNAAKAKLINIYVYPDWAEMFSGCRFRVNQHTHTHSWWERERERNIIIEWIHMKQADLLVYSNSAHECACVCETANASASTFTSTERRPGGFATKVNKSLPLARLGYCVIFFGKSLTINNLCAGQMIMKNHPVYGQWVARSSSSS